MKTLEPDNTLDPQELDWELLEGIDDTMTRFPARARLGEERIVVFQTKNGFRGTSRSCPHMFATMLNAELAVNDTMVRCPLHVFTFRLSDGKGVNCPGFRVDVYDIRQSGGLFYGRRSSQSAPRRRE